TPFNVAAHLVGPKLGRMRYDYRRPKHPFSDKFMMAAGHSVPTCYALWMVLGQALARQYDLTQDARYHVDPDVAMLPIDAIGFRRGAKALAGHAESVDVTNDVNGGPSGVGVAMSAGKAAFWNIAGVKDTKVIAFEGEFAMTEGHAQELKTQALSLGVGKRLRVILSDNNAGIDDVLLGGVIPKRNTGYDL